MNAVCLSGKLGRTPEIKTSKRGKPYATFGVVVKHPFREGETYALPCMAWGSAAEALVGVGAGAEVALQGFVQRRTFTPNEGPSRDMVEIVADRLEVLVGGQPAAEAEEPEPPEDGDPFADQ